MNPLPYDQARHREVGRFPGNLLNGISVDLKRYGYASYQRDEELVRVGPYNEIQLILAGRQTAVADGKRLVCEAGTLCLFPLTNQIRLRNHHGLKKIYFHCNLTAFGADLFLNEAPLLLPFRRPLVKEWKRAVDLVESNRYFPAKSYLYECLDLVETPILTILERKASHYGRFERFFHYARSTPLRDFSLDDIAVVYGVHKNYFSQEFTRLFGLPAKAFALQEKIRQAKALLIETRESVQTIASSLVF
ncbi:MAG: helix-turn-helix transcriptional regulator, partial [Spirochaetia bacterium]|nr:helix-turn-helix transcriptional regulator [Spirochaetia bacterium]